MTKNTYNQLKYKKLFARLFHLIVNPQKEWEKIINEDSDFNEILASFVLPLTFGLTTITFGKHLFYANHIDYTTALKFALAIFTALFAGYWISYKIISYILKTRLHPKTNHKKTEHLSASLASYSSVAVYIYFIITILQFYHWSMLIILLHPLWMAWNGTKLISNFEQSDDKVVVSIITGIIVSLLPYFIHTLIIQLTINY